MESTHNTPTVAAITSEIGRRALAERMGLSVHAVNMAAYKGKFPASWFRVMRDVCAEKGIDCPEDLFAFREAEQP